MFAKNENEMVWTDVVVNLKDINDNAPFFPQGFYYGIVTENGTAGMTVMKMKATDYDDPEEGTNAKLTYSIENNVVDENTGTPIFEIGEDTGVIKTAVCCLDRKRTPAYSFQVVAMDGGEMKATGTASICVKDINEQEDFDKDGIRNSEDLDIDIEEFGDCLVGVGGWRGWDLEWEDGGINEETNDKHFDFDFDFDISSSSNRLDSNILVIRVFQEIF